MMTTANVNVFHTLRSAVPYIICRNFLYFKRNISSVNVKNIRNVGIIAHIDAGKTTTTERMLFYSGYSKIMGEVHDGDTIMDYMAQERERGITINSAAVTFKWNNHKINLIDTPGHVDFTVEVERAMCVLDGVVTIIDASAGVEAQTITVWDQAQKYKVPRIIFCNKMDKPRASLSRSIESIENKLRCITLPLQIAYYEGKSFQGVVDLINFDKLIWEDNMVKKGLVVKKIALRESKDGKTWEEAKIAREKLLNILSDLDDQIAEEIITAESYDNISSLNIQSALRRVTLAKTGIPLLCGSAYKNIGVQCLMDAVLHYLPSPDDIEHDFVKAYDKKLCALAFKTTQHSRKGLITYLRLYSGELKPNEKIYNASRTTNEKVLKLYEVHADDFREIPSSFGGNIVAASGMVDVYTGDTLVSSHSAAENAKESYKNLNKNNEDGSSSLLTIVDIPDPVFFCSVEPASLSQQKPLENALNYLVKEDPSFRVNFEDESGQVVISGMGELHIDVIKDRLKREFKVDCDLGPLQVAYKESIVSEHSLVNELNRTIGEAKQHVTVGLTLLPNPGGGIFKKLELFHNKENELQHIRRHRLLAVENGVKMALMSGPISCYPVIDVRVGLDSFLCTYSTSPSIISTCASECVRKMMKDSASNLLEPAMKLEIRVAKEKLNAVLSDLSSRHGKIIAIQMLDDLHVVLCDVPLSQLLGYSTRLRIITSGLASFTMQFERYEVTNSTNTL